MKVRLNRTLILAALALLALATGAMADSFSSTTSGDIWVYPYGGKTSTLRCWGDGASSVAPVFPSNASGYAHTFAYSYLTWDVSSIATGQYAVTGATLTLTQAANCGYTLENAEANPVEARTIDSSAFSEATWSYNAATNPNPGALVGVGDMSDYSSTEQFEIDVDLLAAGFDFSSYFNSAVNGNGTLALALTSAKLADMTGGNGPFKFWSKDDLGYEDYAPTLTLAYAPVPEPSSFLALAVGAAGILPRVIRRRK